MHSRFEHISIAGIGAAVPARVESIAGLLAKADEATRFTLKRVAALAGLKERHVAPENMFTGDLALAAGRALLENLHWDPKSVDILVFVSQTPDFLSPPTGYLIASRLGISESCAILDLSSGCPGLLYGAWLAAAHINAGCRRALILSGDASSKVVPRDDLGNSVLMGDGAGALALEYNPQAEPISFHLLSTPDTRLSLVNYDSGYRPMPGKPDGMIMDGNAITEFCLGKVPQCIGEHLAAESLGWEEIEKFFLHQPNKMILDTLARRLKLNRARLPMIFADFANCSSASVAINACVNGESYPQTRNIMFCAFGSGLSVASMLVKLSKNPAFPVVLVEHGALMEAL